MFIKLKLRTGQRNKLVFALKALQAAKRTSPLVRQCQQALNDISTRNVEGLYCVPGHAVARGNEIADKLARSGSVQRFVGPEPFLGDSRLNIRRKMKRWMEKQSMALWRVTVVHRDRLGN